MQELTNWYSNRSLLFLGCSLEMDKTLQVLQTVISTGAQPTHFAILGCEENEVELRSAQLGKLGIKPIFYNKNNHDAVPVILERLLEDTNQTAYRQLRTVRSANRAHPKKTDPLLYNADIIAFTGRQTEMDALDRFFQSDARTLWWAVTGPGGMGKSRLVYEFVNRMKKQDCRVHWLDSRDLLNLRADWIPDTPPTVVVLDDVQAHMEIVGRWLSNIATHPRSEKLRILMLEREGKDLDSADWMRGMRPDGSYAEDLRDWCYDEKFLCLKPLGDGELKAIMDSYASACGKTLNAEQLLKTLEKVDPTLKRPLYALAIADARCDGENPTSWKREQVLDRLLDREIVFCKGRLISAGYKRLTKTMETELRSLLARSCIRGYLPLEDITEEDCPKLFGKMDDLGMDQVELFQCMGLFHNATFHKVKVDRNNNVIGEKQEEREIIALSCPDLIKEYLVLQQITRKKNPQVLLSDGWEKNLHRIEFLIRLLSNFSDVLKDQTDLWDSIIQVNPPVGLPTWLFGNLLWGISVEVPARSQTAEERLAALYEASGQDENIAISYAGLLVYRSAKQNLSEIQKAIGKMEEIRKNHSDNQDIALRYASALVNLSAKQELDELLDTVNVLKELRDKFSDDPQIALEYASALVNLSAKQELDGLTDTVSKLEALRSNSKFSDNQQIAFAYATALFNLSCKQEQDGLPDTVSKLEAIYSKFSDNQEIALAYAMVLVNLTVDQELDGLPDTVGKLKALYGKFSDNQEIAAEYAGSLVTLAFRQKTEAAVRGTLKIARDILSSFAENPEIQLRYAKVWFNLTLQQAEGDIPGTVTEIAAFLRGHQKANAQFREALDAYLDEHPEHRQRYKPLLELQGA